MNSINMETEKRKAAKLTLILILLITFFLLSNAIMSMFSGKNIQPAVENGAPDNSATNTDNWRTYRNQVRGFEIKYPARFAEKEYFDIQNNAADATCGGMIEKKFGVFLEKGKTIPTYYFSIYANPLKMTPEDFLICQEKAMQGSGYDSSNVNSIEVATAGEQGGDAAIINQGKVATAVISANGNIYEVRQEVEKQNDATRDELSKILSTVKFEQIEADPQTERNAEFCASQAQGKFGRNITAFSAPIASGGEILKEIFVGCQIAVDAKQGEWLPDQPVELYHIVDNGKGGYDIAWQGNTGKEGLDWIYTVVPVSAGDLDGDGKEEIFFSGKGSCTRNCQQWCLYIPGENDLLCAVTYTRAEGFGDDVSVVTEGRVCIDDSSAGKCEGECTVLLRTLCFDSDANTEKYKVFKDYLSKKIAPGI